LIREEKMTDFNYGSPEAVVRSSNNNNIATLATSPNDPLIINHHQPSFYSHHHQNAFSPSPPKRRIVFTGNSSSSKLNKKRLNSNNDDTDNEDNNNNEQNNKNPLPSATLQERILAAKVNELTKSLEKVTQEKEGLSKSLHSAVKQNNELKSKLDSVSELLASTAEENRQYERYFQQQQQYHHGDGNASMSFFMTQQQQQQHNDHQNEQQQNNENDDDDDDLVQQQSAAILSSSPKSMQKNNKKNSSARRSSTTSNSPIFANAGGGGARSGTMLFSPPSRTANASTQAPDLPEATAFDEEIDRQSLYSSKDVRQALMSLLDRHEDVKDLLMRSSWLRRNEDYCAKFPSFVRPIRPVAVEMVNGKIPPTADTILNANEVSKSTLHTELSEMTRRAHPATRHKTVSHTLKFKQDERQKRTVFPGLSNKEEPLQPNNYHMSPEMTRDRPPQHPHHSPRSPSATTSRPASSSRRNMFHFSPPSHQGGSRPGTANSVASSTPGTRPATRG